MSNREYFDICDDGDHIYEQEKDRDLDRQLEEEERQQKEIPCRLCGNPTPMMGTQLCDGCWELETRIKSQPDLAERILNDIQQKEDPDYELISIDYSKSSWEQFEKDLLDPSSTLVRALESIGEPPC